MKVEASPAVMAAARKVLSEAPRVPDPVTELGVLLAEVAAVSARLVDLASRLDPRLRARALRMHQGLEELRSKTFPGVE